MKPESRSRRLFGITRAKGKMYEFGIPENSHLQIPDRDEPASLLLLAVGILGDHAFSLNAETEETDVEQGSLEFAASYFDALLESQLEESLDQDTSLLAAAAYYLADRPGSSRVMAERHRVIPPKTPVEGLLRWLLIAEYERWEIIVGPHDLEIDRTARLIRVHFLSGADTEPILKAATTLRELAYRERAARELLLSDLVLAVIKRKIVVSSWTNLPTFSKLKVDDWHPAIASGNLPVELWPAQLEIGRAGLFRGQSGVVQMPTSAGKTKSLELILRSGFLSGRTKLAAIVVPFRALSHEVASSLSHVFKDDADVRVNELSDALQMDLGYEFEGILADAFTTVNRKNILVMTPEKFLFIVRQRNDLLNRIDLLIYDEAHQFDSEKRGVTYELLLTEVRSSIRAETQVVALSAVLRNVAELSTWLLGDSGVVVDGSHLMPTARATAFASWLEKRGQLQFYESSVYSGPDYFVPRVINEYELTSSARKKYYFPDRGKEYRVTDIALQIGFRLVSAGAVAIFSGRRSSASKLARRAVEVYERGLELTQPITASDQGEVEKLSTLIKLHFGESHQLYKAARIGVFVHHGHTPNGLRVAIEHAMQMDRIRFVICTSTLAQGVNLPIRYLVVNNTRQGRDQIKVRDFQNLLGRAGRAGMHTEGLVIFADPNIYGTGQVVSPGFRDAVHLLDPSNAENTSSSLLSIVQSTGSLAQFTPVQIAELVAQRAELESDRNAFTAEMRKEINRRGSLLSAVESYLMANRDTVSISDFRSAAAHLCEQTFAFALASTEEKEALRHLFVHTAESVDIVIREHQEPASFGRTLLNARQSTEIYEWVQERQEELVNATTNDEIFSTIWPLCSSMIEDGLLQRLEPQDSARAMALAWIEGENYAQIIRLANQLGSTKPHGKTRRRINEDDILKFIESEVTFEAGLIVAAVCQFLGEEYAGEGTPLATFLKSLKYGVSDELAIFMYEAGFSDRIIATLLSERLKLVDPDWTDIRASVVTNEKVLRSSLEDFPSYFSQVLDSLIDEADR